MWIMSSVPIQIAEIIQTASINRAPSPHHDLNPSTAASNKQPVRIQSSPTSPTSSRRSKRSYEVVEPVPRNSKLPPLPDLRFEQSYLASLQGSQDWKVIGYITIRDHVRTYHGVEVRYAFLMIGLTDSPGPSPSCPRHTLDSRHFWLAALEQDCTVQWSKCRK